MDMVMIVVYYNGIWEDTFNYKDYEVTGILIPNGSTYEILRSSVCDALELGSEIDRLDLQFQIKDGIPPMTIKDDKGLNFYLEMKRSASNNTSFPLLVTTYKSATVDNTQKLLFGSNSKNATTQEKECEEIRQLHSWSEIANNMANYMFEQEQLALTNNSELHNTCLIIDPHVEKISIKQVFRDKSVVVDAMNMYSIKHNYQHKVKRSSKTDYVLVCLDDECKWYFHASSLGKTDMFKIRSFEEIHTCSLSVICGDHRQATSTLVGNILKRKLMNPKKILTPNDIVDDMMDDYSVSISYQKAWRGKEKALELSRGRPDESYQILPSFLFMLQQKNPGTITDLVMDNENRFKYLFFAIGISIENWQHCTPIVVVDGTFLKSMYGGTLLSASSQNTNRKIFPLAFAIVDSENDASWEWFMRKLKESYGEREGQCIISDRHKSIEKATLKVYPRIMHGYCGYHLLQNIKKKIKRGGEELKNALEGASKAYNMDEFERYMCDLDRVDGRIRSYLANEVGFEKWTRVFSPNKRFSTLTSNIAESINSALNAARELPVSLLVESIRCLVQKWHWANKHLASSTFTNLSSEVEESLKYNREWSRKMKSLDEEI
ncbi:uncharacterized protein LOC133822593 [Humulus lupulus]|uniref:uncharacterized protein LOC133822593 n=1 Tax=Humulus lupulus TaxID=3486 RepID=UPI002B401BB8|nr:uncharacterized protein LOC133822593 [Humulus lupulus]